MKFWLLGLVVLVAKAGESQPLNPASVSEEQWRRGHEEHLLIRQSMASDEVWSLLNHLRIRYEIRKLWRKHTSKHVTFTFTLAEPKWLKFTQLADREDLTGFDGQVFWQKEHLSIAGMERAFSAEMCRDEWLMELPSLLSYPDLRFAHLGHQTIAGVALIHLAVFPLDGPQWYSLWVHPETKQVQQLCYWTEKKSGISTTYLKYSDYRDTKGLTLPFKTSTEGTYPAERIMDAVEINPEGERSFWRKE